MLTDSAASAVEADEGRGRAATGETLEPNPILAQLPVRDDRKVIRHGEHFVFKCFLDGYVSLRWATLFEAWGKPCPMCVLALESRERERALFNADGACE